jgi:hypothetical protein
LRLGELLQKLHDRRRRFTQPGFPAIDRAASLLAVKPEVGGKGIHRESQREAELADWEGVTGILKLA